MITKGIPTSTFGERALEIQPPLTTGADAADREAQGWARRTRYFAGRSVTDLALKGGQRHYGGHLATAGQKLAPGVVVGLEAMAEGPRNAPILHIAPGIGLCVSGEDVRVPEAVALDALSLMVIANEVPDDDAEDDEASLPTLEATLGQLRGAAFVILLRPVEIEVTENVDPDDPCELDPGDISFRDELLVDGCRVVLYRLDSLPDPSVRWRNELAYMVFDAEAALGTGEVHPWEPFGVPIGVLAFPPDGGPPFVDIHAVARAGGSPAEQLRLLDGPGTPRLWQARLEQMTTELRESDIDALQVAGLDSQFRWLPPVGLLPPGTVAVRGDHGEPDYPLPAPSLFPEDYVVEVVPVELEAVDEYLHAGAFQAPLDTEAQEQVQILVPVPQQHFDPDLLVVEDETPDEFRETIEMLLLRLNHRLGRRYLVRVYDTSLTRHLDSRVQQYPDEPRAVDGEVDGFFPPDEVLPEVDVPPPEEPYGHDLDDRMYALIQRVADTVGVEENPARNPLAIMLYGIADGVTVPAMNIAPLSYPLNITRAALPTFFVNSRFRGKGFVGFAKGLTERLVEAAERLDLAFAGVEAELHQLRSYVSDEGASDHMASSPVVSAITSHSLAPAPPIQLRAFRSFMLDRLNQVATITEVDPSVTIPTRRIPTGERKVQPSLLFGRNLVDRMRASVAATAAENARHAKISALRSLLYINDRLALSLDGIEFPVLREAALEAPLGPGEFISISTIRTELARAETDWPHDDVETWPGGGAADSEATFFAQSVRSLEELIAALRIAEARLTAYEAGLEVLRDELQSLRQLRQRIRERLDALQDEIQEVRHDVRVARALEREEVVRATRLNRLREQVIEEHVPFLLFRRPRTVDAVQSPPTLQVSSSQASDVVPECLDADFEAPEQLRAMIDLVRDAPLKWLKIGPAVVRRVNRIAALRQAAEVAWHRSRNPEPFGYRPFDGASFETPAGLRMRGLFSAHRSAFQNIRLAAGGWLSGSAYLSYPWHQLATLVEGNATVNDFLLSPHGRQDAAQRLTEELTNIFRVAACLYEHFGQVLPSLRLRWVQQVSEEDEDPLDLDDLSKLPGWEDVDRVDRRDIQTLVDWLFDRFRTEEDGALQFVRDIIRVTLLLSGHAPVRQVIEATVVETRPVQAGGRVSVALDPERVRVGMHVQLYASEVRTRVIARGIIDDLASGVAAVRVVTTDGNKAVSPTRAEISEPSQSPRIEMRDGSSFHLGVAATLS
ncbi:MAG: hypothetical protein AAF799_14820 [Myxococcota bacterium]